MQSHFQEHVYSGFEPLQVFDVVYGGHFEHRLMSARRATMVHRRMMLGEIRIETGWYDFPVIAKGAMPPGSVCIGMVAEGIECTRYNTMQVSRDVIQVYAPHAELMYHAAGASRWINFTIESNALQRLSLSCYGRPLVLPLAGISAAQLPMGRGPYLQQLVDDAFALAASMQPAGIGHELATQMGHALSMAYVDALLAAQMREGKPAASHRYDLIVACERIARDPDMSELDLSELAGRSGLSLRSLERVFKEGVGMTPGRWFRNIRLNGALRDILLSNTRSSITDIASRWGFRHLSRFSQHYKDTFGELPSQTLRRAQAN